MNIKSIKRIANKNALATQTYDDYFSDDYKEYIFSDTELKAFADAIIKTYKKKQKNETT